MDECAARTQGVGDSCPIAATEDAVSAPSSASERLKAYFGSSSLVRPDSRTTEDGRFVSGCALGTFLCLAEGRKRPGVPGDRYHRAAMADSDAPLSEQLEGIGTQLLWVRDYL
jgi:hypothetical protein